MKTTIIGGEQFENVYVFEKIGAAEAFLSSPTFYTLLMLDISDAHELFL